MESVIIKERSGKMRVVIAVVALLGLLAIGALSLLTQGASANSTGEPSAGATDNRSAAPADCGQAWHVVTSQNGSAALNHLYDVDVISDNDVWAVGDSGDVVNHEYHLHAMAEHWNGSTWSLVTVPQPGTSSTLLGVSALSSTDIWAVGYYVESSNKNFILHYDGTGWMQVPSPNVGTAVNSLIAVVAVSPTSAWAVGVQGNEVGNATSVLQWDGSNWASIPSPSPDPYDFLSGVTATGADDMWAVGYTDTPGSSQPERTLSIHCTRVSCTQVTTPNSNQGNNELLGVVALSASDVWAVGYSQIMTSTQDSVALMLHWNGEGWSTMPAPPLAAGTNKDAFHAVIPLSDNAVWAVGVAADSASPQAQTYAALWNGSSWSASTPLNLSPYNVLEGVDALSVDDVWAVGTTESSNFETGQTLVERYNDPCITPTPTPPACSVDFTDVPQGSTFYPYVHCLSCQNILGGYTTGCPTGSPCFKPSSPVTRGQLAKIVSNAAGFSEIHTDQAFEDVASGSTFYDFVERLASREIIGGYPCGGAGEPCGSGNLPYFRPNTNVTRGQNAKIVAIADDLPAPTPGQQTFEDVAVGSTFWQWVEALSTAGAVSGYPCGGAGEPCGSGNLPYFRPNAQVTRGQAAKIVSNTFFPDCQSK